MTRRNPKDVVYDAMVVYNYDNQRKFLERQLPCLMTNIVLLSRQRDVSAALDFIAKTMDEKARVLLMNHFPTIFPKIVTKVCFCLSQKKEIKIQK